MTEAPSSAALMVSAAIIAATDVAVDDVDDFLELAAVLESTTTVAAPTTVLTTNVNDPLQQLVPMFQSDNNAGTTEIAAGASIVTKDDSCENDANSVNDSASNSNAVTLTAANDDSLTDLEDIFSDIYYMEDLDTAISGAALVPTSFLTPDVVDETIPSPPDTVVSSYVATTENSATKNETKKRKPTTITTAKKASKKSSSIATGTKKSRSITSISPESVPSSSATAAVGSAVVLTEEQKQERRNRNREHAKRSRLRKRFMLENLQQQVLDLETIITKFKTVIRTELGSTTTAAGVTSRAEEIIQRVCNKNIIIADVAKDGSAATTATVTASIANNIQYIPQTMPSGFGPVKTLIEPDFRLMKALSLSQQNFTISDPKQPDNPIVYVSQGFLTLTGYKLNEVLGRNCRFLQGPETDQRIVKIMRDGIAAGEDTSVCLLNYRADGSPFWNQFYVTALRDASNEIVNYVGVQCKVSKDIVDKYMAKHHPKPKALVARPVVAAVAAPATQTIVEATPDVAATTITLSL